MPASPTPAALEEKLLSVSEPYHRSRILSDLIATYIYTDPRRATALLDELDALYQQDLPPEGKYSYHLHRGNLLNQRYEDEAALRHFELAVEGVNRYGDVAEKIEVYLDYVGVLLNVGQFAEARDYYERTLRFMEAYATDQLRARAQCRQGFFYLHDHSYAKATPRFLEADRLLTGGSFELTAKDHYFYTLVHSGLGTLWTRPDTEDKAVTAFRRAIDRCETVGLGARLPWHKLNLGKVLMGLNQFEEAMALFREVIRTEANGSRVALAAANVNLANCLYLTQSPAAEVRTCLDAGEALYRAMPHHRSSDLTPIDLLRATLYLEEEDYSGGIEKLQDILAGIEQDPASRDDLAQMGYAVEICQLLARSYADLGAYDYAYSHQRQSDDYLDRYYELQDAKRQEQFAAQFEAEVREKERESLQLRASQLQLRALRAQMNPHFLYNALNSIQSFITTNDASTASRYLAKFAMLMRRSLEYSNREYITLDDEIHFLRDYMDINCHLRFAGKLSFTVTASDDLDEDVIGVPTMILQPYVENAIEHGLRTRPQGTIRVDFRTIAGDDDNLLATVEDDGIGRVRVREMQKKDGIRPFHQSRGTAITLSRLELMTDDPDNRVTIDDLYHDSGQAAGTRVTVRIPITDVPLRRTVG